MPHLLSLFYFLAVSQAGSTCVSEYSEYSEFMTEDEEAEQDGRAALFGDNDQDNL